MQHFDKYKLTPKVPAAMWQNPLYFLAFGLGSGAMPIAPGTFGTLMSIPFYLLLRPMPLLTYAIFLVGFIVISSLICSKVSREIKVDDHQGMCIDEFAGFFVTMFNAPWGWQWVVLGFILFRIFDIVKPWPIYIVDRKMHSGFGMILDDVLAGVYSCIVIQILAKLTGAI